MLKVIFFSICLLSTTLFGQTFSKKYFASTDWFSSNKDSCFYKKDTLKIIKHSVVAPNWASELQNRKEYAEFELKYLNTGDFVEFGFSNNRNMHLSWRHSNYINTVPGGQWTWSFDEKTNILSFYDHEKKLVFSFQPISEKQIQIESRFAEHKELLKTIELTAIRIYHR